MIVKVCVGSSCHLKGSYDVIENMKELLKKYEVEDDIELQASFCLGFCAQGVTMKIEMDDNPDTDGIFIHELNKDNIEERFVNEVLPLVK
ncbi:MAG: (2Fe-2S) ferredoxin domain-containing protein [Bacteroidales bacterium]